MILAAATDASLRVDSEMVKPSRTLAGVTERTTAPTLTLAVCAICSRNPSCTVGVKSETLPATTMEVVIIAAVGGVAVGGEAAASKGGGDGTSKSESNVLVLVM